MRKMMLLAVVVAMAALMLAAAPAMANDHKDWNDKDWNDKDWNDKDWNDHKRFDDDHKRFNDDDFFDRDFDFDDLDFDSDQDADSGNVDQTFVVTNTGDNSNQCVGIQGVANTGNAQNQLGFTTFDDGFNNDFDRDRFFHDNDRWWDWNDRHDNDRWWDNRFDRFDFDDGDFEFDDVGSTIEVNPTNTTRCDQQVNQAAAAYGGWS